jgi:hypothetical protein
MYETSMLFLNDKESLSPGAGPLSDAARDELRAWATKLEFADVSGTSRKNLEQCKATLVEFIDASASRTRGSDSAPGTVSGLGDLWANLARAFRDFKITGAVAMEHGFSKELAEKIDQLGDLEGLIRKRASELDEAKKCAEKGTSDNR